MPNPPGRPEDAPMQAYFEGLYGANDDPYGLDDRWYEQRKRALLLASLPRPRYRNAYEPGCGAGALTAELAPRCQALLAADFSARAVEVTRTRTASLPGVRVERHRLPDDWPGASGPFDLIVLSELGYFLDADAMAVLAQRCAGSLAADGTLLACDWRIDFPQRRLATQSVHALLENLGLHRLARHEEDDFLLQVWSADARSVAQREAIR